MRRDDSIYEYMPRQVLNRHWLWVFIWTAAGVLLSRSVGAMGVPLAFCFLGVAMAILYVPFTMPRRAYVGFAFLCLALGLILYQARKPDLSADALHQAALSYPTRRMAFEGIAVNTRVYHQDQDYLTFEMKVTGVEGAEGQQPLRGRALVRWSRASAPVFTASTMRVYGRLSPHLGVVNHGVRGVEDVYHGRGVFSAIHARGNSVEELRPGYASPRYWASRLRQWQRDRLAVVAPASVQPFINGVWLGARGLIGAEEYERFIHAGTAHILAVSGVHVGIIAFTLRFLLRMTRLPRRPQLLVLLCGVFLFALMTGARTATLRAALMVALYFSYDWFDREPDAFSVLGLCGFGFLLWNPTIIFEPGFLMSFGSVASILLFHPAIASFLFRLGRLPAASLATTLSVQIVTWPIAAWYFNIVPVAGIVANVVVVPLLTVALWLCFVTVVIATFSTSAAMIPGYALLPVVTLIQWTNSAAATLPLAYGVVLRPSVIAVLLYGAAAVYFYRALYDGKERRRNVIAVITLLCAAALLWRPADAGPRFDFIDVGHGDAIFVRAPGGTTLLMDGGDASEYTDMGARTVAPFLYANGVRHLDYVAVSHSHRDHIGGLFHIIERFSVGSVLMGPESEDPAALEREFLELCAARDVPVIRLAAGDTISAGEAVIQAAHPDAGWVTGRSENDRSLVLFVAWPGGSALLAGDVETDAEALLADSLAGTASVLKVPHHGSATSSTDPFLRRVSPDIAVASLRTAGARAPFMPARIENRYADLDIPLLRTDWHGGVRVTWRDDDMVVSTARDARGYCLTPTSEQ